VPVALIVSVATAPPVYRWIESLSTGDPVNSATTFVDKVPNLGLKIAPQT
jgi:hypothetical protein